MEPVAVPGHTFDLVQIDRSRRRGQHLGLSKSHRAVVETENPPVEWIARRRDDVVESAAHRIGDAVGLCLDRLERQWDIFRFGPPLHQFAGECLARELSQARDDCFEGVLCREPSNLHRSTGCEGLRAVRLHLLVQLNEKRKEVVERFDGNGDTAREGLQHIGLTAEEDAIDPVR